jgi:hypothetical protein
MEYIGYMLAGCVTTLPLIILEAYIYKKFLHWLNPPCITNTRSFLITFTTDIRYLDNNVKRAIISRQVSVELPFHLNKVKHFLKEDLKKDDETIKEIDSFAITYMSKLPIK